MNPHDPDVPPLFAHNRSPSRNSTEWIGILSAGISVTLIVAYLLSQPLFPHANQTAAIQEMRTIWSAELRYKESYGTFACPLAVLGGNPGVGSPSPQAAQLIDPSLATGQKSEYVFTLTCGPKVTIARRSILNSFKLTAIPKRGAKSGDHGFCIDESSTLKYDPTGGTNCTQPVQ